MAISSSLQQISGGFAATLAGIIVKEAPDGAIEHFDRVGYVLVSTTLLTLVMMYYISRRVEASAALAQVGSAGV